MAIPFRDLSIDEDLGFAAYLRFVDEPDSRGMRGALFLVDSKAEPVAFCFSRISLVSSVLWRAGEARRSAVAKLTMTLFSAVQQQPSLVLALATEVCPRVFTEDIAVGIPLCRVGGTSEVQSGQESIESVDGATHLYWVGDPPAFEHPARRLLETLQAKQLAFEPFDRVALGLEEAFAGS
ncbi:MAG: hypothetical protein WEB00_12180 [Dehalococcoidia bacterium]